MQTKLIKPAKSRHVIPMPERSNRLARRLRPAALRYCEWWEASDEITISLDHDSDHVRFNNETADDSFTLPLTVDAIDTASARELRDTLIWLLQQRRAAA